MSVSEYKEKKLRLILTKNNYEDLLDYLNVYLEHLSDADDIKEMVKLINKIEFCAIPVE